MEMYDIAGTRQPELLYAGFVEGELWAYRLQRIYFTATQKFSFTARKFGVVMRSRARVCVRLFVYNPLTFESLDLERSLLVCLYIKVIGSKSKSQEQNSVYAYPFCGWSAFDWTTVLVNIKLFVVEVHKLELAGRRKRSLVLRYNVRCKS